jgi:hypothetical protein
MVTRVSCSAAFWWRVHLTLVIVIIILQYHLIRLNVLFLFGWRVYGGSAWFSSKFIFFSFTSFPSLSPLNYMLTMQKIISDLQFIFYFDSVALLLFVIILSTLIIFNFILFYFQFNLWSFNYYFLNLLLIILIAIYFFNHFLNWFVFFFQFHH